MKPGDKRLNIASLYRIIRFVIVNATKNFELLNKFNTGEAEMDFRRRFYLRYITC